MMPTVATIEGVKIDFHFSEHPPPHFHAVYGEFRASISIDEDVILKGFIPPAKFAMIRHWKNTRKKALRAAFTMSTNHIDPGAVE
jgi:hypothetical protein